MTQQPSALDLKALRSALGGFVTGITVVTTKVDGGQTRGFTANSFTSVSLEPPLILICIGRHASSFDTFSDCSSFAVNVLGEDQEQVSGIFASKAPDKFDQVSWREGVTGSPLIKDSLSWFDCDVEQRISAGDHMILIGRVKDFDTQDKQPLGYFKGKYIRFGLEEKVIERDAQEPARFGAILDDGEQIVLQEQPDGSLSVPLTGSQGQSPLALRAMFTDQGIPAKLSFLYSVFNSPDDDVLHIVYRGGLTEQPQEPLKSGFIMSKPDEIDWARFKPGPVTTMLKRYVRERSEDRFGIYVETEQSGEPGQVAVLDGTPKAWADVTPKQ